MASLQGTVAAPGRLRSPKLSPLTRRRLRNFRANKRGFWSLIIFLVLFVITFFSEVIANDRPLVVSYKDQPHFPSPKASPQPLPGSQAGAGR